MKNFFIIIGISMFLMSFSPFLTIFDRPFTPKRQVAYKLCQEISEKFKEKYHFKFSGIWEAAPEGKYELIGLNFDCPKLLTKEEGRELLLKCAKEMLAVFNSHPEFEEHMDNVPFTYNNISISIFVHPPGNYDVYAPNVAVFTLNRQNIRYETEELIKGRIHSSTERESLEEAMKIVEQSKQAKEKNAEPESLGDANEG